MRIAGKSVFARSLEAVLGRRHLYRLGRFLFNYARLDLENDMQINGELYVQRVALARAGKPARLLCLDVGANIGLWSKALLQNAERSGIPIQIHAFEPCTETFSALNTNLNGNGEAGRFVAVKKACSDHIGRATLNIVEPGCCGVNSIVAGSRFPVRATEEVELTTLDSYCAQSGISAIRLLKIDAEGHDLAVMKGASEMLRRGAIDVIQFEYNQSWIEARLFLRDAFELLQPFDYEIGKITRRGVEWYRQWSWELETFMEGNYVACTAAWKQRFEQVEPVWMTTPEPPVAGERSAGANGSR